MTGVQTCALPILVTGHGIDVDRFTMLRVRKSRDLITVGRVTESKNLLTLVNYLCEIRKQVPVMLTIVGAAVTKEQQK